MMMVEQSALLLPPDQAVATISATIVEELQPALERLTVFAELGEDWDSYGAAPISPLAIDLARELAAAIISRHALSIRPDGYAFDVIPLPDGGVQLECNVGARHLEIAIDPQGEFAYLAVIVRGGERQSTSGEHVSRETIMELADDVLRPLSD